MSSDADGDELGQINALRRRPVPGGGNAWEHAVLGLRVASVLATQQGTGEAAPSARVAGAVETLAPEAWSLMSAAAHQQDSILREALQEMGAILSVGSPVTDLHFNEDVASIVREVQARRSAVLQLGSVGRVQVIHVSHDVPIIPTIYTGLCLLSKVLLDTAVEAMPSGGRLVSESLNDRAILYFGPDVDPVAWRIRLSELWQQRLGEIFSAAAEARFGELANVLLLTTGMSQRTPLDYVPRPLIAGFVQGLIEALPTLRAKALAAPGADAARLEDAAQQTRKWLEKNTVGAGYGTAKKDGPRGLAAHPAARLASVVHLGTAGADIQAVSTGSKRCVYCGDAAESIETPQVAEGGGVKKFSKQWIATGNRSFANLCARCSLASFLQLRLLGCYTAGRDCGPKRFFSVFHEGVYPRSRLEFLTRWANAHYTLLRDGAYVRGLGQPVAGKKPGDDKEGDDVVGDEGAPEVLLSAKQDLKRLRDTLGEIETQATELRRYLGSLRQKLPQLGANVGISVDEVDAVSHHLEDLVQVDPSALGANDGARVIGLVRDLLALDSRVAGGVAQPIVSAFRRRPGADRDTGIAVHDLGGPTTARLVLLALPVLPQAKKGNAWIDLSRHFSASRAAVTLTLGWLWRKYPGTYWWGVPVARDDGLIHTPFVVAGEREVRQFEVAWTLAQQIVPFRAAEYPQLLSWAEKLVDSPIDTMAMILRRQGDARSSVRHLTSDQLAEFVREVTAVGPA